jgi:hypothetical protein
VLNIRSLFYCPVVVPCFMSCFGLDQGTEKNAWRLLCNGGNHAHHTHTVHTTETGVYTHIHTSQRLPSNFPSHSPKATVCFHGTVTRAGGSSTALPRCVCVKGVNKTINNQNTPQDTSRRARPEKHSDVVIANSIDLCLLALCKNIYI